MQESPDLIETDSPCVPLTPTVVALCYHDVLGVCGSLHPTDEHWERYAITAEQLREQLGGIEKVLPCPPTGGGAHGRAAALRQVLLTFDDGGTSAVPVASFLKKRGWVGRFFIPTWSIGEPGHMNAQQIRGLHGAGHLVGSHSHTHPERMSALDSKALLWEWRTSVARLSDIVGEPVWSASVAGGYCSRRVVAAAAAAGVKLLFTSEPTTRRKTVEGCSVIGRFAVLRSTTLPEVIRLVRGNWAAKAWWLTQWKARNFAKSISGPYYLTARDFLLRRSIQQRLESNGNTVQSGRDA